MSTALQTPLPDTASRLDQVWAALDLVNDPELDEPITDMGFVEEVAVNGEGGVSVAFRLPTYWCSPNFAFLMAQDIKSNIDALHWVTRSDVQLQDHMAAEEMNSVINAGGFFSDVFNGLTKGEDLKALREKFDVKAFQRRQEVVIKSLQAQGVSVDDIVTLPLAKLKATNLGEAERAKARYLELAEAKGILGDLALTTYQRAPLTVAGFSEYMGLLRSVRINMEFSGSLCRGLKTSRYLELDASGGLAGFPPALPASTQAEHCG
jgi:metal-sulfur cluster biosynthetic enzyme